MSFHNWLLRRENGLLQSHGDHDFIMRRVFKSMRPLYQWNDILLTPDKKIDVGGVFNLEFSPQGNVLVAACEKKSIVLFDVVSRRLTDRIMDAHASNVNCIKFLNNRHFATCSDDTTVALWDLRFLKKKMRSLHGHSNWVKSIEYSKKDNLLVTSAFDGSLFTWDINSYTEQGLIYQKVFHTSGLMRCRISQDSSKLVMCTTGGYLMIIHDLDLTTLHKDLCGFRPVIFRLMQMGQQYLPQAAKFDHVFSKRQKKNRVELVTDFPDKNDAEVILALQIHPSGDCFLSRNISFDGKTEWLTVHDLKEEPDDITERARERTSGLNKRKRRRNVNSDKEDGNGETSRAASGSRDTSDNALISINRRRRRHRNQLYPQPGLSQTMMPLRHFASSSIVRASGSGGTVPSFVPDIWAAEVTVQDRALRQNGERDLNSANAYNSVYAISSGVMPAVTPNSNPVSPLVMSRNSGFRLLRGSQVYVNNDDGSSTSSGDSPPRHQASDVSRLVARSSTELTSASASASPTSTATNYSSRQIFQNPKKLTYYIQELNRDSTFIKEPCFSSDGRIICSPYEIGIRLLGFTEDCSIYPHHHNYSSADRKAEPLSEILTINAHSDIILSTRFSPREPLLVSGCRSGKINWYQPNL